MLGRPGRLGRDRHRQKRRNPARCQAITVSGFTMTRAFAHPGHKRRRATQNARSRSQRWGRGRLRLNTTSGSIAKMLVQTIGMFYGFRKRPYLSGFGEIGPRRKEPKDEL